MSRWRAWFNPRKSFCMYAGTLLNIAGLGICTLIRAGILTNLLQCTVPRDKNSHCLCNLIVICFLLSIMQSVISYSFHSESRPPSPCTLSCDWSDLHKLFNSEGCKYSTRTFRPQRIAFTADDAKKNQHNGKTVLGWFSKTKSFLEENAPPQFFHPWTKSRGKREEKLSCVFLKSCAKITFRKVKASL